MLPLLLAAASAPLAQTGIQPGRQARATVTIVRIKPIRLGIETGMAESVLRSATVRERDGSTRAASLVEFY